MEEIVFNNWDYPVYDESGEIISVTRIPDKEVFSIGDKVYYDSGLRLDILGSTKGKEWVIKSFKKDENWNLWAKSDSPNYEEKVDSRCYLKKAK